MRRFDALTLMVIAALASLLFAATVYRSPQAWFDRLIPRVAWGIETASGTTDFERVEDLAGYPQVFAWGQPLRVAVRTADVCACFSMTSTLTGDAVCGSVTDASDGNTAVEGLCVMLPAGSVTEIATKQSDYLRVGVGRRSGVCATDTGRPCRVDGDCVTGTCSGGGVSVSTTGDIRASGAYLLLKAADDATAGDVTVSIIGSEHR